MIIGQGVSLVVQLAAGIIQAIPELVAQLPQIIAAIVGGLADVPGMMLDIGKNVVSGLWDGIRAMTDWIKEKVTDFFGGIVDGAKELLGIHSPSTVFADIGGNMAKGVGKGFDENMAAVTKGIESSLPTEFNMPTVNAPDMTYADASYKVTPIVDTTGAPEFPGVSYEVTPVIGDFTPPDISTPEYETDEDNSRVVVPDPDEPEPGSPPAFAPVITIQVNGNMDEEMVENLRSKLYDIVKELFEEFRTEELERAALKNQYAF